MKYSVHKYQDGDSKYVNIDAYDSIRDITLKGRLYADDCIKFFDVSNDKILQLINSKKLNFNFLNCEFIRTKTTQLENFSIKIKKFKYLIMPSKSYEGSWALNRSLIVNGVNYGADVVNTYSHANLNDVIDDALEDIEDGLC